MKILFLSQIIPWPLNAGPRIKTWNVLNYLCQSGHEVILAAFVREEEALHVAKMSTVCTEVHTVKIKRSRIADIGYWIKGQITGRPFLVERDDLAGMRHLVEKILAEKDIDVIHADQLTMVQFALSKRFPFEKGKIGVGGEKQPKIIFDAHNAVLMIFDRMGENAFWGLKPVLRQEARKIKHYEGELTSYVDQVLAVSKIDRDALLEAERMAGHDQPEKDKKIAVVPIAVDTEEVQPVDRHRYSKNILAIGSLHYPPNADGIRWFTQEVFPRILAKIPRARLTIIGKNPPKDILAFKDLFGGKVNVTGYVPDLQPYFEDSAIEVVPVRAGGGMRVRILEAFSRAMPGVTTTVGLEGIDAVLDRDVLVADDPEAFANDVIRLLKSIDLQDQLAENGRKFVVANYDWQVVLKKLGEVYSMEKGE